MAYNNQQRRYDIDWLRVLAFGVLILYHIGMYYVADWGWHIKSETTSVFLQDVMILTNPWRMSLLFFLSALALAFAQQNSTSTQLVKRRSMRLLLPLFFGIFVIVVPQIYYEALSQDLIEPGIFVFWVQYINPRTELLREHHTIIGLLTWNHLWFLPYVWVYSLLFIILKNPLSRLANSQKLQKWSPIYPIIVAVIALSVVWITLRQQFPPTNALINDWYNHGKYLLAFSLGYTFAQQPKIWQFVIEKRRLFLVLGIIGYALLIANQHSVFASYSQQIESSLLIKSIYALTLSVNHWAWLLAVVGFAGHWLNKPNKWLNYATQAILPWYILHQTLIIVFAWWMKPLSLPLSIEALILLALTIVGCLVGYEIIKRINVLRRLCGLRERSKSLDSTKDAQESILITVNKAN